MNTILTVVAMETVDHDYRPTFVHFCKKSMFNDDVAFDSLPCFFLQTSKVQYVCGEHMTSKEYVASFGRKAAIYCLVGMPKMRWQQRYSMNCVFGTDYKRKKLCQEQKAHMATRKRKRQSISSIHDQTSVHVDSRSET